MKSIFTFLFMFIAFTALAQTLYTHNEIISITQDSVTVKAGLHKGNIQWQKSLDNQNWINMEGKTSDSLKVISDNEASYRAQITEGTCFPVYSDTAKIIIDSKVLTVYDMRQDSLWDYWVTSNDGSNFLAKVNNQKPVSVYYKPDKNSVGYFIFFDERGLPSKLVINDNIFLFENFRDSLIDVSWVLPSGEIQIFRDVKSDIDLNAYNLKSIYSTQNNDWLIFGLKTASQAISVASCISGLLATSTGVGAPIGIPLMLGCGATVVGLVAEILPEDYKPLGFKASFAGGFAGVAGCVIGNDLFNCAVTTANSIIKLSKDVIIYLDNDNVTTAQNLLRLPTISTSLVTNITQTTAICGGNITSEGGSTITDRGVCWNTNGSPTPADNHAFNLSVTGSFTADLTGLTANTTYFARAYATNSTGTSYGDEISFKTNSNNIIFNPNLSYGTVTDIDGNIYKTIQIGTQTWMAENLKTTKYNDGASIPKVTDDAEWSALTTGAYCWYNNDTSKKNTYGALYNWYSVNTGRLSPTGWHVATDVEWTTLTNYLGGATMAGSKLKESGTSHWPGLNTDATNETGFTALPGGYRYFNGLFNAMGYMVYWWSSAKIGTIYAWSPYIDWGGSYINWGGNYKEEGFSVRCVKD